VNKCTKCYAFNKPEAKSCGSCGQLLLSPVQSSTQRPVTGPAYSPPVRSNQERQSALTSSVRPSYSPSVSKPSYTPPVSKPSYTPPVSKPSYTPPIEIKEFSVVKQQETEEFTTCASEKEDAYFIDTKQEEVWEEQTLDTEEDFQSEITQIKKDIKPVARTKGSESSALGTIFSVNKNPMEMFIMNEILSSPKCKRRKFR